MKQTLTTFEIKQGLFKLELDDYHAILGVPIGADEKEIRKRYLYIARKLHPDSCKAKNDDDRDYASQILSKLVNPAYENLYKKNARIEHQIVLQQTSQRLAEQEAKITITNDAIAKLYKAKGNAKLIYQRIVQALASEQYESIEQIIDRIGQMSELNTVYLTITNGKGIGFAKSKTQAKPAAPEISQTKEKSGAPAPAKPGTQAEAYIRRAEQYIEKNDYTKARIEVDDALKIEPSNSSANALKGLIYLHQKQTSMAKIYISKACQANPEDPTVIKCKEMLARVTGTTQTSKNNSKKTSSSNKAADKSQSRGGLFGLFGSKKK